MLLLVLWKPFRYGGAYREYCGPGDGGEAPIGRREGYCGGLGGIVLLEKVRDVNITQLIPLYHSLLFPLT
jgi:hypothetical protein